MCTVLVCNMSLASSSDNYHDKGTHQPRQAVMPHKIGIDPCPCETKMIFELSFAPANRWARVKVSMSGYKATSYTIWLSYYHERDEVYQLVCQSCGGSSLAAGEWL